MKYIGFSLSKCVKDILEEKVCLEDVMFIITGTFITNQNHLNEVIDMYRGSYWDKHPINKILDVVNTLMISGKIIQPRVLRLDTCNIADGHWVETYFEEVESMFEPFDNKPRIRF